jgi:hypothetical protein
MKVWADCNGPGGTAFLGWKAEELFGEAEQFLC